MIMSVWLSLRAPRSNLVVWVCSSDYRVAMLLVMTGWSIGFCCHCEHCKAILLVCGLGLPRRCAPRNDEVVYCFLMDEYGGFFL